MVELNGVCTGAGTCGLNTTLTAGECLPKLEAICTGETRAGMASTCVASLSCGSGTRRLGNECIAPPNPGCGSGTALISGVCVVNLGTVCSTDTAGAGGDRCVSSLSCGTGTHRAGSECLGGGITCGPGTALQGTSCVVAPQTGPLTMFLSSTTLARASHAPTANGFNEDRRFVATELSQGNADAWVNVASAMIGTGRALHLANYSSNNITVTPTYFTVEDDSVLSGGVRKCQQGLTPSTYGTSGRMSVNFFNWNGGTATAIACGYQGTIRAERASNPATGTLGNKLTMNVVLSDGTTLNDFIAWF